MSWQLVKVRSDLSIEALRERISDANHDERFAARTMPLRISLDRDQHVVSVAIRRKRGISPGSPYFLGTVVGDTNGSALIGRVLPDPLLIVGVATVALLAAIGAAAWLYLGTNEFEKLVSVLRTRRWLHVSCGIFALAAVFCAMRLLQWNRDRDSLLDVLRELATSRIPLSATRNLKS